MKSVLREEIRGGGPIARGTPPKPNVRPPAREPPGKPPQQILFVRLVSLATGKPISKAKYEVVSPKGSAVAKGETDFTGTVHHDVPEAGQYRIKIDGSTLVGLARSIAKASATKDPTEVRVGYLIDVKLEAVGGTPARRERVAIFDPDTKAQVGEPVETDDEGRLTALVPEDKEYDLRLVEDEPEKGDDEDVGGTPDGGDEETDDDWALLYCVVVDREGKPIAGEPVKVSREGSAAREWKTDAEGEIEQMLAHGRYSVEVRGQAFEVHTVHATQAERLKGAYTIVAGS